MTSLEATGVYEYDSLDSTCVVITSRGICLDRKARHGYWQVAGLSVMYSILKTQTSKWFIFYKYIYIYVFMTHGYQCNKTYDSDES